jgi:hypothetical protein
MARQTSPRLIASTRRGPRGKKVKSKWIVAATLGTGLLFGAAAAAAQSYNPIHWIKKGPTASEELTGNTDETKKLNSQLQAILPARTSLSDACSAFKDLKDCVATLHVSHNLKIKFNCLKWEVTAVQPTVGSTSGCKVPQDGKAVGLVKAIQQFKPNADAKTEAKTAEKRAQEDIKDAKS